MGARDKPQAESGRGEKFFPGQRTRARRSAVQALYQWLMLPASMRDVIDEFTAERKVSKKADLLYFEELLTGIERERENLERRMAPLLDRALEQLDPVEKAILLIGFYELLFRSELEYRVVLNEAIELAKMFGAETSFKYVNGVLDRAAREIRVAEKAADNAVEVAGDGKSEADEAVPRV